MLIIKSRIDATSYEDACYSILQWLERKTYGYIIAANVHVVMTGYWQPNYQEIINNALLVTPDGMPLVWGMRWLGVKEQTRVYGPDLMLALCHIASQQQISIYLYGGTPSALIKLQENLQQQYPQLHIVGCYSPPFHIPTPKEEQQDINRIKASGAKIVFVGLGCPKQEIWMAKHHPQINAILVGVGAAFSFHSKEVSQAPRWMMDRGLEWLHRFWAEPRRLWRRYLINNPAFIILFSGQLIRYWLKLPND